MWLRVPATGAGSHKLCVCVCVLPPPSPAPSPSAPVAYRPVDPPSIHHHTDNIVSHLPIASWFLFAFFAFLTPLLVTFSDQASWSLFVFFAFLTPSLVTSLAWVPDFCSHFWLFEPLLVIFLQCALFFFTHLLGYWQIPVSRLSVLLCHKSSRYLRQVSELRAAERNITGSVKYLRKV
ncbi:hypothetical protein EDD16DRAFT_47753 [Pisolithus croceorrhizus]|nr:hypothetical protein EDD16DRAFT_47753 [Pisolithus croceorrhizus]